MNTPRIATTGADAFEGPAFQYTDFSDGHPAALLIPVLIADGVDGCKYQLANGIKRGFDPDGFPWICPRFSLSKAQEMAAEIKARGYIGGADWHAITDAEIGDYLRGSYGAGGVA
jgi:hypothetical protein